MPEVQYWRRDVLQLEIKVTVSEAQGLKAEEAGERQARDTAGEKSVG